MQWPTSQSAFLHFLSSCLPSNMANSETPCFDLCGEDSDSGDEIFLMQVVKEES